MNEIAYALYEGAENLGLLFVLEPFGKNLKVKIPLSKSFCNRSVDELELSVRSRNGLMRSGLDTVEKLVDGIMREGSLNNIRNLGKKSIAEIKTILLVRGYQELNDREKLKFWHDFLEDNNPSINMVIGGASNA